MNYTLTLDYLKGRAWPLGQHRCWVLFLVRPSCSPAVFQAISNIKLKLFLCCYYWTGLHMRQEFLFPSMCPKWMRLNWIPILSSLWTLSKITIKKSPFPLMICFHWNKQTNFNSFKMNKWLLGCRTCASSTCGPQLTEF